MVKNRKTMDNTLKNLGRVTPIPKSLFVLLLLLYGIATFLVSRCAMAQGSTMLFAREIPNSSFPAVFSSLASLCIIFLVLFFRKAGYIASLLLLFLYQFPVLIVGFLIRNNVTAIAGIFSNLFTLISITIVYLIGRKSEKYQYKIHMQAVTDILTGLPNRFACGELIDNLIRKNEKFAVLSVDINNFKGINDTMGHEFGDGLLVNIADRWKSFSDQNLTDTDDFVARLGGDEFAIVIRGFKDEETLLSTISIYKNALEQKLTIDDTDYFMTAHFGYAICPEDGKDTDSIISNANAAMHEAQRRGTSNPLRFTPDILRDEKNLEIERKIRTALSTGNIFPYLQPQYDITHKLIGFEALARMKDEDGKFISPVEFIPVAEKAGLVDRIDTCVFAKSAAFVSDILRQRDTDITVSVNVSVRHLMKNNFIEETSAILEKYNIPANYIEIEITESVMIDSADKALERINRLKGMGFKIAIDDFGTGYSSLSYLNTIPSDLLKIDKSFIDVMNNDDSSKAYVATIVSIGHIMNLKVISEGVESPEQVETLKSIGCDYIQGYIWGKPLPYDKALEIALAA